MEGSSPDEGFNDRLGSAAINQETDDVGRVKMGMGIEFSAVGGEGGEIEDDEVRFPANVEGADKRALSECVSSALGREMKGLGRAGDGEGFVGIVAGGLSGDHGAHDLPEVEFRTSGHIRAEADANAGVAEAIERQESAGALEICGGAMRDGGSGCGQAVDFLSGEPSARRQQRLLAQQSAIGVEPDRPGGVGVEGANRFRLARKFGVVGLNAGVVLVGQSHDLSKKGFRTGEQRLGGKYILEASGVATVPLPAKGFAFCAGTLGGGLRRRIFRPGPIPHQFPHRDPKAALFRRGKCSLGAGGEGGGMNDGTGGPVADEIFKKSAGLHSGDGNSKLILEDCSLSGPRGAGDGRVLGEVSVEIDEAGNHDRFGGMPPADVAALMIRLHGLKRVVGGDAALFNQEGTVTDRPQGSIFGGVDEKSTDADRAGVRLHERLSC